MNAATTIRNSDVTTATLIVLTLAAAVHMYLPEKTKVIL
jgi:hypothetical protein